MNRKGKKKMKNIQPGFNGGTKSVTRQVLLFIVILTCMGCMKEESETFAINGSFSSVNVFVNHNIDVSIRSGAAQNRVTGSYTYSYRIRESRVIDFRSIPYFELAQIVVRCREQCDDVSGELELVVPHGVTVYIQGENGQVTATDFTGEIQIFTEDGPIVADNLHGDILAQTGNGDITIGNAMGQTKVTTLNGNVTLSGIAGNEGGNSTPCETIAAMTPSPEEMGIVNQSKGVLISIQTITGNISASCIFGNLWMDTEKGNIVVNGCTGKIIATADNGNISARNTVGDIDLFIFNGGNVLTENVHCEACLTQSENGTVTIR